MLGEMLTVVGLPASTARRNGEVTPLMVHVDVDTLVTLLSEGACVRSKEHRIEAVPDLRGPGPRDPDVDVADAVAAC